MFAALYHHMYGLKSPFVKGRARSLPVNVAQDLIDASDRIRTGDLPEKVQDAMDKATGDKVRRDKRHDFLMESLKLEPAN